MYSMALGPRIVKWKMLSDDVCCSVVLGTLVGVFVLCGPGC